MSARVVARALACACSLALAGCPTRYTNDAGAHDVLDWRPAIDPRVPNVGAGHGGPSCSSDEVVDINQVALHEGAEYHVRVETIGRRNELNVDCVDRDSSEVVLRYTAPPVRPDGTFVRALRVSTEAPATAFDTVLSVRNQCGPDYRDYSCNNDGFLDDGRETRRSTVYYTDLEAEQYVFILVDGYDGSAGRAEVVVTELSDVGVLGAPCLPIPPALAMSPLGPIDGLRCPHEGLLCHPGAASDGTDLCLPLVPLGAPCDPDARRSVCEPDVQRGVVCAVNPADHTQSVCALPGTAPGATCRPDVPGAARCDGRLACRPGLSVADRSICVPLRSNGAGCEPSPDDYRYTCEPGLTCCGDIPDAGATYYCRPVGTTPCYVFTPPPR